MYFIEYEEYILYSVSQSKVWKQKYKKNALQAARNLSARSSVPGIVTVAKNGKIIAQFQNGEEK